MEIKEIKPVNVIYRRVETTLKELFKYVGTLPEELKKEAEEYGAEIVGPQIWSYYGGDGNPDTKFKLDISFPVKEIQKEHPSCFKTLDSFKCATTIHQGSWDNFKNTYEKLIAEIYAKGHALGNCCREIYINCDFNDPEKNITEVQIGIN